MKPPPPPPHIRLTKADLPFWHAILRSKAEWGASDLPVVAQLARCQRDIEVASRRLQIAGMAVLNSQGKVVINPDFEKVDRLIKLEMALLRTLALAGRVAGDKRDQQGRRLAQREAEKIRAELATETLLAGL